MWDATTVIHTKNERSSFTIALAIRFLIDFKGAWQNSKQNLKIMHYTRMLCVNLMALTLIISEIRLENP